ncbi:hypothetical protein F8568_043100 [Actinomadura sp. LD22]|uniref:Nitrate/nitrite sensing protein domain-containing protein n=1 Tax=Actinomadura physcomitrii TaxID=2650748 RepID=A0A6I4MQK1_9ACTN|nr:nitrate- and nitrite sensing domain-containing protein [Actinomadura physcomitrii]MWA07015.1 hypothetical protein [Actinomadura physcomitrii]
MAKPEHVHGSHGRPRTRPIRRRIGLLLVVPLASLVAIWSFSAVTALTSALHRLDFGTAYDRVGGPAGTMIGAVQAERAAAVTALRTRSGEDLKPFRDAGPKTDASIGAFRSQTLSLKAGALKGAMAQRLQELNASLDGLRALRPKIASGRTAPLEVIEGYSRVIDSTDRLETTLSSIDDIGVYQQAVSLLQIYWAGDFMQREDQLLSSVRAGRLTAGDRAAFARWAGAREQYFDLGGKGVEPDIASPLRQLTGSPSFASYLAMESGVVEHRTFPDPKAWRSATATLSPLWVQVAQKGGEALRRTRIEPIEHGILLAAASHPPRPRVPHGMGGGKRLGHRNSFVSPERRLCASVG